MEKFRHRRTSQEDAHRNRANDYVPGLSRSRPVRATAGSGPLAESIGAGVSLAVSTCVGCFSFAPSALRQQTHTCSYGFRFPARFCILIMLTKEQTRFSKEWSRWRPLPGPPVITSERSMYFAYFGHFARVVVVDRRPSGQCQLPARQHWRLTLTLSTNPRSTREFAPSFRDTRTPAGHRKCVLRAFLHAANRRRAPPAAHVIVDVDVGVVFVVGASHSAVTGMSQSRANGCCRSLSNFLGQYLIGSTKRSQDLASFSSWPRCSLQKIQHRETT